MLLSGHIRREVEGNNSAVRSSDVVGVENEILLESNINLEGQNNVSCAH